MRLLESLRAVFYAPYYTAMALGAFTERGVDVELCRPEKPEHAATSLFDGTADVTWGGPMRMMQLLDAHPERALVGFAEAVTRDPFFLVGRCPNTGFRLTDLSGLRLATVAEVPTPWMCLQDDLRRSGIDPERIDRVHDKTMAEQVSALRSGEVDVVQVFEPWVDELVRAGEGSIWYAGASRGPTTYTTLYTSRTFAEANPRTVDALTRGVLQAQQWLHAKEPEEVAALIRPFFPDLAMPVLIGSIRRYKEHGVWGRDPRMPVVGFVRLKCALLSGGFIRRDIPFDECIDNEFANRAIADRSA